MFRDREEAGRELGERLRPLAAKSPVVLAVPRGGVPIGLEIARALAAPLDLVLVRKIGAPAQPELAVAAVADGDNPQMIVNVDVARLLDIDETWLEMEKRQKLAEIERRRRAYLAGRVRIPLAGRTVIVADDGIATGATTRAVLQSVRAAGPREIILAIPVAPPETVAALESEADRIECLEQPSRFGAISMFYENFPQVGDDEVRRLLDEAARLAGSRPPESPGSGHGFTRNVE
ncbi:MAG: phosphoribosyltransferase [Alphaproteobacteria bacterium]